VFAAIAGAEPVGRTRGVTVGVFAATAEGGGPPARGGACCSWAWAEGAEAVGAEALGDGLHAAKASSAHAPALQAVHLTSEFNIRGLPQSNWRRYRPARPDKSSGNHALQGNQDS
jgi:hypothetical protein